MVLSPPVHVRLECVQPSAGRFSTFADEDIFRNAVKVSQGYVTIEMSGGVHTLFRMRDGLPRGVSKEAFARRGGWRLSSDYLCVLRDRLEAGRG